MKEDILKGYDQGKSDYKHTLKGSRKAPEKTG